MYIKQERVLAMRLSALLHDADDKKYFDTDATKDNAKSVMQQAMQPYSDSIKISRVEKEALEMISLVSASDNGNTVPKRAQKHPELLWPRYSDRLEAIGAIGAVRCLQYNEEQGRPRCVASTPKPKSVEEVWRLVTPERLENYMATKTSSSMMDHYFDKLLQIAVFEKNVV
jgi:hypothetical protein